MSASNSLLWLPISEEMIPVSDIQLFQSDEFGTLRTFVEDEVVLFAATDVAKTLGYGDATHLTRRLDEDEKGLRSVETPGGKQKLSVITEAGLYSAVLGSKVEGAKAFKRWVTHAVLPALRQNGAYVASNGSESDEDLIARALVAAKVAIDRKDRELAEMRPKALFADAVSASDGTCLVGELAKMLRQNGVEVGQNRLFSWLRDDGFLGKTGSNRNVPTQRAMELGLFRIKETAITHSDGHVSIKRTTKVTGKGQRYFLERYGDMA